MQGHAAALDITIRLPLVCCAVGEIDLSRPGFGLLLCASVAPANAVKRPLLKSKLAHLCPQFPPSASLYFLFKHRGCLVPLAMMLNVSMKNLAATKQEVEFKVRVR